MPWFTKQRKKKARNTLLCLWGENFGIFGQIQGRFRPVSSVSGLFRPYRSPASTTWYGRYGPILAKSARFGMNRAILARIEPSRHESEKKKKKKTQTRTDARATASDAGATPTQPHPCFLPFKSLWYKKQLFNISQIFSSHHSSQFEWTKIMG